MGLSPENIELSELAIVGATGDLQDFYGKGFNALTQPYVFLEENGVYGLGLSPIDLQCGLEHIIVRSPVGIETAVDRLLSSIGFSS